MSRRFPHFTAAVLALLLAAILIGTAPGVVDAQEIPPAGVKTAALAFQATPLPGRLPTPLSTADQERYQRIFALQTGGQWKAADRLIENLENRVLLGHVLAQRYLHPTKYRSRYKELKAWMAEYADHPEARRIYKLALKRRPKNWRRPKPPVSAFGAGQGGKGVVSRLIPVPKRQGLTRKQRRRVASLMKQMRWHLRKGWTKSVKETLRTEEVRKLFSPAELDAYRARLGFGYFLDGRDEWAVEWAGDAAARSGAIIPEGHWTAGLALWRLGRYTDAAHQFEHIVANTKTSPWMVSAGAFWAARAYLRDRQPEKVNALLAAAAEHPRTFYGLLAHRVLGRPSPFRWETPTLERSALGALSRVAAGRRAVALLQVGQVRRAESELRRIAAGAGKDLGLGILLLASQARMPALAVRLDRMLFPAGGGYDGAAYPIPGWAPDGGFSIDPALIYAVVRQESGFNPKAKSWAGARGLMQLMPATASFMARDRGYRRAKRKALFEPGLNLKLGQRYLKFLMGDDAIRGNLFLLAAAWNGGPGNLSKWRRKVNSLNDPLFFIESLPSRETRIFIERVLTNLWIYRSRLGQPAPSLDAVAAGGVPHYTALGAGSDLMAEHGQD